MQSESIFQSDTLPSLYKEEDTVLISMQIKQVSVCLGRVCEGFSVSDGCHSKCQPYLNIFVSKGTIFRPIKY